MCGIAGIVDEQRSSLHSMLRSLSHRGPDAAGVHELENWQCALGHVRLSILDLDPRSNQPFRSPCGRYALTFNGEVYNYVELRKELESGGVVFQTTSDTEVLLHWLIRFGAEGLGRLEGMFAFCFADDVTGQLLLVRDQIGEKPLYYSQGTSNGRSAFAFASEPATLLQLPWVDASLDTEGLADYLRFLYTAPPHTLYAGVRELPPGHFARFDLRERTLSRYQYYSIEAAVQEVEPTESLLPADEFRQRFDRSVSLRLQSDVPVGLYLSGGMDSNAIALAMRNQDRLESLTSFTVRFEASLTRTGGDESGLAAQAAAFHGIGNCQATFDAQRPLLEAAQRSVEIFGQPFGNATALIADQIAKLAARHSRVCLVGDGGDELLIGYPRYHGLLLKQRMERLPRPILRSLALASRLAPERGRYGTTIRRGKQFLAGAAKTTAECYLDWLTYTEASTIRRILNRREDTAFNHNMLETFERHRDTPLLAAAIVDLSSFIPFNLMQSADRTGMQHSLELRCPFLAPALIHHTLRMPSSSKIQRGRVKPLLVDAFAGEWPPQLINQPKRPFNPPVNTWLRQQFDVLNDALTNSTSELSSLVGHEFIQQQLQAFQTGQSDNSTFLWGLLSLETWLKNRHAVRHPGQRVLRTGLAA